MMKDEHIEQELRELIAEIIELEPEKIALEANLIEDLGVDSMMALEILAAIEKKYKLKIPEEHLTKLNSLQAAVSITKTFLNKK